MEEEQANLANALRASAMVHDTQTHEALPLARCSLWNGDGGRNQTAGKAVGGVSPRAGGRCAAALSPGRDGGVEEEALRDREQGLSL